MNRRKFLRRTSALSILGLAGCTSDANEPAGNSDGNGTDGSDGGVGAQPDNGTASPTAEPTETPTQTPEDISTESGSTGSASDQAWGTGGDMNGINFSFTSRSPECGQGEDTAAVDFQTEDGQVAVDGTISGSDLCKRAQLASVEHDESADRLVVAIETVPIEDCGNDEDDGMSAGQCLVDIAYDAQFAFDGELPGEVAVSHDGQGVATAAYGSAGATPTDG